MVDAVETLAYTASGGLPWHGLGQPVNNDLTTDEMLVAAGLNWEVSKRPLYFAKTPDDSGKVRMKVAPEEYALVRDSDEYMLDTVGSNFKPVQNKEMFDFFKRFVAAGDMQMETAGALRNGKFTWALAKVKDGFTIGKNDRTESYLLMSQPHQFGYSLTIAWTPIRVVCWNTLNYALGSKLDGGNIKNAARFRMVHSREFDDDVKRQAEVALGMAHEQTKAFSHTSEFLSQTRAKDEEVTEYFRDVLRLEQPEDDTEEAKKEAEEQENLNVRRFREALLTSPGADFDTAKGTWFGALNSVTYTVDHVMGRTSDTRLFSAWHGAGRSMKQRAVSLAVQRAEAA